MPKYQFTGEHPMIFANLSFSTGEHRPAVIAQHAPGSDWPAHDGDGSTVTLYPGDTLELGFDGYPEHAYLVPLEVVAAKATVGDIKAELTARGIAFDPKAKKADLETLLAPHLDVITNDGIISAQSTTGDASEIDLTLSGPAADTSSTSTTSPEE